MATQNVQFYSSDPGEQAQLARQAALIQQQQAMAQALLQEGMTPINTSGRQVGGVGYRISPLEGLAKMLQTYVGKQGATKATGDMAQMQAQAFANAMQRNAPSGISPDQVSGASQGALGEGAASGDAGPTNTNAQRMAQALMAAKPQINPNNPTNIPAALLTGRQFGYLPEDVFKAQSALYAPTAESVQSLQAGTDPMAANRTAQAKGQSDPALWKLQQAGFTPDQIKAYVAAEAQKSLQTAMRPNQSLVSQTAGGPQLSMVAPDPEGNMQYGIHNGQVSAGQIPGAVPNRAAMAGGMRGAQAPYDLVQGYNPDTQQPVTGYAGNLLARPGAGPGVPGQSSQPGTIPTAPATGIPNQIGEMQKRWGAQQEANSQVEPTKALLQNIKGLADKAATGQFTDRLQLTNSLLSLVGNDKAGDAVTANNLLDKYSNQIVARLGQGGLGTDAARTIIQSANPNAKMNPAAIKEAADNLIGAQDLVKAKTAILSQFGNNRNAPGYQQAEQRFDAVADPRVFQLRNMDAQSAARYLSTMPPQIRAELQQKAMAMKQMGVFGGQ